MRLTRDKKIGKNSKKKSDFELALLEVFFFEDWWTGRFPYMEICQFTSPQKRKLEAPTRKKYNTTMIRYDSVS